MKTCIVCSQSSCPPLPCKLIYHRGCHSTAVDAKMHIQIQVWVTSFLDRGVSRNRTWSRFNTGATASRSPLRLNHSSSSLHNGTPPSNITVRQQHPSKATLACILLVQKSHEVLSCFGMAALIGSSILAFSWHHDVDKHSTSHWPVGCATLQ